MIPENPPATTARPRPRDDTPPSTQRDDAPRLPPAAVVSERAIICAVIEHPDRAAAQMDQAIAAGVTQASFTDFAARNAWAALQAIHVSGRDYRTVQDELTRRGQWDGGAYDLHAAAINDGPWAAGLKGYIDAVIAAQWARESVSAYHAGMQDILAGATPESVAATVASKIEKIASPAKIEPLEPLPSREDFPMYALPPLMQRYAAELSEAMCIPVEYAVAPILAAAAACIGNTRCLAVKPDWHVPSMLWMGIVGKSGTCKTPPVRHVLSPIRKREQAEYRKHAEAMGDYAVSMAEYDRSIAEWKKHKGLGDPPVKPAAPVQTKYVLDSATMEANLDALRENPRGLLRATDEGMAIFNGLNQYRSGADQETWLSIYSGDPIKIDRKTGENRSVYIAHPCESIITGFQPKILQANMSAARTESGFMARFLFTAPPGIPKIVTSARVSESTYRAWGDAIDRLLNIPMPTNEHGDPEPFALTLTPDAQEAFFQWCNKQSKDTYASEPPLCYALNKIEEIPARLALVFAVFENPDATEVTLSTMQSAIRLGAWFRDEATRLYGSYAESPEQSERHDLIDIIQRHGGRITARELCHAARKYRAAGTAESALEELIADGCGKWETSAPDSAGRPKVEFVFLDAVTPVTVTQLPEIKGKTNNVTSYHVTAPNNENPQPPEDDVIPMHILEADAEAEMARQRDQESAV